MDVYGFSFDPTHCRTGCRGHLHRECLRQELKGGATIEFGFETNQWANYHSCMIMISSNFKSKWAKLLVVTYSPYIYMYI